MDLLLYSIVLPILGAIICLVIPKKIKSAREMVALVVSFISLILGVILFKSKGIYFVQDMGLLTQIMGIRINFAIDYLNSFILLFVGLFAFLIVLYSLKFMEGKDRLNEYYAYLLFALAATNGALLSNNLLLLIIFWDIVLLAMYGLISIGGAKAASGSGKKAFIIVGVSDFLMLLGVLIIWYFTRSLDINVINNLAVTGVSFKLSILAFVLVCCGALAKAGSMPFHTWIPDASQEAPVPVMAFLPASLDKLLGIYLLARIVLNLFELVPGFGIAGLILMFIGAFTIIAAVMMALVQHDLKKLLSYHAVSQVGYMILGIGTGNPIGIVGGIFHMLNNTIYKSCLFLGAGNVEKEAGTTQLDKLGGLARKMPITYITFLIAALSISGIPPFNGFVSKWMVYQGVIQNASMAGKSMSGVLTWFFLVAAFFGSALTLASFMKLIYSVFLEKRSDSPQVKEVSPFMWIPMVVLAFLCVFLGVFAQIPIKSFFGRIFENTAFIKTMAGSAVNMNLADIPHAISLSGIWNPTLATLLILIGIIIGFVIYLWGNVKARFSQPYVGGEDAEIYSFGGTQFYTTIKKMGVLARIYSAAEKRFLDFYEWGVGVLTVIAHAVFYCIDRFINWLVESVARVVLFFSWVLRSLHIGALPTYMAWYLIGFSILLYVLIK